MIEDKLILVVDDEPEIVKLVRAYHESSNFNVVEASDGPTALEIFRSRHPDLIILDLMIPGIDGIELTKEIRKDSQIPIIMLTARSEEIDRLIGLEVGADDYVVKPFSPRELVARVKAVLRRSEASSEGASPTTSHEIRIGAIHLDIESRTVERNDQEIKLSALQFDLLAYLMRHPGRVFTRSELLEQTQGHSIEAYERTVDAHIKNIRKLIGDTSRESRFIHTVHGVGYRFQARDKQ